MRTPSILAVAVLIAGGCERKDRPKDAPAPADVTAALPASTDAVVRVSLADLRGTEAWPVLEGLVAAQRPLLDTIEDVCGLRPLDVIDAVTVSGDGIDHGLSLAIIEGRFTAQQAERCFAQVMSADRDAKVTSRRSGAITELTAEGFSETVVVRWFRDGAVLVPLDAPTDRARLERVLDGPRLPDGAIAAPLAATAGAAIRVAAVGDEQRGPARLMEPLASLTGPVPPLAAHASVHLRDGAQLEMHLTFATEAAATEAATAARGAIADLAANPTLGAFAPLAGATGIETRGATVVLRASLTGEELAALADQLGSGLAVP